MAGGLLVVFFVANVGITCEHYLSHTETDTERKMLIVKYEFSP